MLWLFCGVPSLIPYFCILFMPVYGSFYGAHVVLYLSILLLIQSFLSSITSKYVAFAEPVIQIGFVLLLVWLPAGQIPYILVWLYDMFLWGSEPLWQLVEVLGILQLSRMLSQQLCENIDDNPVITKTTVLSVASVFYVFFTCLFWSIWSSQDNTYRSILVVVLCLLIMTHAATIMAESGIISDAAVVSCCSVAFLYAAMQEVAARADPITIPEEWIQMANKLSFLKLLINIVKKGLGSANPAFKFFSSLLNPWFLSSAAMRVCSVFYSITLIKEYIYAKDEDEESDEDDDDDDRKLVYSPWQSPLLIRLIVLLVYTQFLVQHLHRCTQTPDDSVLQWMFSMVSSLRVIQAFVIIAVFLFNLWRAEREEEC